MEQQNKYKDFESLIFSERKGKFYLGDEEIKPDYLDYLNTQAFNLKSSELYDVLKSTIINEAYNLALKQSSNFEEVQFAKALYHSFFVIDNILEKFSNMNVKKLDK